MQWDVHLFPTKGKVGGYLSQTPARLHGIIWEVLCLQLYSVPAGKQPSEGWEAGSTAGTAPCPRLPGAVLTLQQCHLHAGAAQPSAAARPALCLPPGCAGAGSSTEPRERTATHPQLLGALEWQQSPWGCGLGFTAAPHEWMLPSLSPSWSQDKLQG